MRLSLHNDKVRDAAVAVAVEVDMESGAAEQALVLLCDVHTHVVEYLSYAVVICERETVCALLNNCQANQNPSR